MRRTKEQAAATGRQILQAAERLFLEQGYDNVSLEEIAAAAGVTRGAVHWHFKNKRGLLVALRDDAQAPFRSLIDSLSEESGPEVLQSLGEVFAGLFEKLENDPRQKGMVKVLMRLSLTPADGEEEDIGAFRQEMNAMLLQIFRVVEREDGLPSPWKAETAASVLGATLIGLVEAWAVGGADLHLVPDGQRFIKMVLGGWRRSEEPQATT